MSKRIAKSVHELVFLTLLAFLVPIAPAAPQTSVDSSSSPHRLRAGAVELGVSASFVVVEEATRIRAGLRVGKMVHAPLGLGSAELEVNYSHISSLDVVNLECHFFWHFDPISGPLQPFIGPAAGVRQEWLGSFRQARYPVGLNAGFYYLVSHGAALRWEVQYRHILHDPVRNYSEYEMVLGISLLLSNQPE